MTEEKSKGTKPFVPVKKTSPFCVDPYNNRGGKKGVGAANSAGGFKGGKAMTVSKFKGGSGGDR